MAANGYGILLGALAMSKGYWAPSHPADVKISGIERQLAFDT